MYNGADSENGEDDHQSGFFKGVLPHQLDVMLQTDFGHLSFMERDSSRKEVIKQIASRLRQDSFFSDAIPGVCVENGFLSFDAEGGLVLQPHDVAQRARVKLPFRLDKNAATSWVEEGFALTLRDQSKLRALQEAIGATTFNIRVPGGDEARRMIVLHGPRRSGKSTVIEVLKELFPAEAVASIPPNEWGREYSRAQLDGKSLNFVTELGGEMRIPAEQLKKIVSCETVTARHPYGRQFNFTPSAWHWFATNELPRTTDKTNAFERRLLCIGFDRSLEDDEIDPSFVHRIAEDPSALICWAAEGARRLWAEGKFTLPRDHEESCARMQHGFNISAIMATRIERAPGQRITTTALKAMAGQVAEEIGMSKFDAGSGEMKAIVHELRSRYGAERRMTGGKPFYEHIRVKADLAAVEDVRKEAIGGWESAEDLGLSGL